MVPLDFSSLRSNLPDPLSMERDSQAASSPDPMVCALLHDLRSPLFALLGYLDLIDRHAGGHSPEKVRDCVRRAREAGVRLNHLTSDYLDRRYSDSSSAEVHRQSTPVEPIFHSLANIFGLRAEDRGIDLRLPAPGVEALFAWADADLLARALENLVANALKFTAKGGIVSVTARRDSEGTLFEVSDTGRGIPPEAQQSIFQPRTQLQAEDFRQGFGLGLAIVKWIVGVHQGRLFLDSAAGQGSRFSFWFPDGPLIPLPVAH